MTERQDLVAPDGSPLSAPAPARDIWGKFMSVAAMVGSVAAASVPIVATYIGSSYTQAIKQGERETQYVQIAVDVLSQPPSESRREAPLREWGVEVLDRYSEVKLTPDQRRLLIQDVPLISSISERTDKTISRIEASLKERASSLDLREIAEPSDED